MRTNVSDDWMNSTLWTDEASAARCPQLYIKLKVFLLKEPARTLHWTDTLGAARQTTSIDWDSGSWLAWGRGLKRAVEDGWSDKLWLVPNVAWLTAAGLHPRPAVGTVVAGRPLQHVALRLRVEYAARDDAHLVVRSSRRPAGPAGGQPAFFRSSMEAPFSRASRRCSLRGDDTFGYMDTGDLIPKASGQVAAVHEFGHYIGLSHVNAAGSPGDTNADLAYGAGDHQRGDLMGAGTRVEPWHAYPWCRRLRLHLGGDQPAGTGWHSTGPPTWLAKVNGAEVIWTPTTRDPGRR